MEIFVFKPVWLSLISNIDGKRGWSSIFFLGGGGVIGELLWSASLLNHVNLEIVLRCWLTDYVMREAIDIRGVLYFIHSCF